MLITRVGTGTECEIGKEQCAFRQGRGCMDQVFAVSHVCTNGKNVFWALGDLEKPCR